MLGLVIRGGIVCVLLFVLHIWEITSCFGACVCNRNPISTFLSFLFFFWLISSMIERYKPGQKTVVI